MRWTRTATAVRDDAGWRRLAEALGEPDEVAVVERLDRADPAEIWLALAVLGRGLPEPDAVARTVRAVRAEGIQAAIARVPARREPVEIVVGAVLVDAHHTARTDLATGIQRVARETVRRWDRDQDVVVVGWTSSSVDLRRLAPTERRRALFGGPAASPPPREVAIVPWRCTYLLPELVTEAERTSRLAALARWSGNRTGVIGFDCVPISSAETVALGMSSAFSANLGAVRYFDAVATISQAAGHEYRGWRAMLAGSGAAGPAIHPVVLPVETVEPGPQAMEAARLRYCLPGSPLVLVVGSHEPRKNHLTVLHAAELLWREGLQFSLLFVGGNSWHAEEFVQSTAELRAAGRSLELVSAVDDEALWSLYRLSRGVLFPSLNEGFGLPVAEALASGTPVVTSAFGSMAEIAEGGGALLVDPRDDASVTDALRTVLTDDAEVARLREEAADRPARTWDEYASEVWAALTGTAPSGR